MGLLSHTRRGPLFGAGVGAGIGAGLGALGGGMQKRHRRKTQEKAKSEKKPAKKTEKSEKKEEKEAALRSVIKAAFDVGHPVRRAGEWLAGHPRSAKAIGTGAGLAAAGGIVGGSVAGVRARKKKKKEEKSEKEAALRKVAFGAALGRLPWGKILGGTAAAGAGLGLLAAAPPALRALNRGVEHYFDPFARQQYDLQRQMYPQMMMMNMLRAFNPYGMGGGGGAPPMMAPEDRDLMRHATYLQSLRSRAKTLREAFGA